LKETILIAVKLVVMSMVFIKVCLLVSNILVEKVSADRRIHLTQYLKLKKLYLICAFGTCALNPVAHCSAFIVCNRHTLIA